MDRTARLTLLLDRVRHVTYLAAFAVAIGSVWAVGWANAVTSRPLPFGDEASAQDAAGMQPSAIDPVAFMAGSNPTEDDAR